jgi:hypothetical protein
MASGGHHQGGTFMPDHPCVDEDVVGRPQGDEAADLALETLERKLRCKLAPHPLTVPAELVPVFSVLPEHEGGVEACRRTGSPAGWEGFTDTFKPQRVANGYAEADAECLKSEDLRAVWRGLDTHTSGD